jgi:hypothetical protein
MSEIDTDFDYGDFKASPEVGDLKVLSEMAQRAHDVQEGLKKLSTRTETGKQILKDLLEYQIPETMARLGVEKFSTTNGLTISIKVDDYASIPSLSAVEGERDPDVRDRLLDRRNSALTLVAQKAPTLIKRSYEIDFDRDDAERALDLEAKLRQGGVPFIKGETVHPKTLAKWVKDCKLEGIHLSQEELETLGVFTKKVAKISK